VSAWAAFWSVVAIGVVSTAAFGALMWAMIAAGRRRDERATVAAWADLNAWADRNGWAETDPPPELTVGGLGTVLPDEEHRFAFAGTHAGRPVAAIWCVHSDNDGTARYVTVFVGLAEPVAPLRIRHRYGFLPRRRHPGFPDAAADARFDRAFNVEPGAGPGVAQLLTAPVRRALLQLRSVTGWTDSFELVRLEGRVMRVVMASWPGGPSGFEALLTAACGVAAVLPSPAADVRRTG
jgi:hypothetical protein